MLCSKASLHFKVVNFDSLPIEFCHNLEPHKNENFFQIPFFPIMEWLFNYHFSWEIIHHRWTVPTLKLQVLQICSQWRLYNLVWTLGPNLILTLISLKIRSSKSNYSTVKLMYKTIPDFTAIFDLYDNSNSMFYSVIKRS